MPRLRFLVDVGVGRVAEAALRETGCDVLSVADLDDRVSDAEILKLAAEEHRIVLTMDRDFGELIFRLGMAHHGVLLLRLQDAGGPEKARRLAAIVEAHSEALPRSFAVYHRGELRVRPLSQD
jgi:predicted nuclease of predicted toxin-antitoxin system